MCHLAIKTLVKQGKFVFKLFYEEGRFETHSFTNHRQVFSQPSSLNYHKQQFCFMCSVQCQTYTTFNREKNIEIFLCVYVPILSLLRNHGTSNVVLCHPDIYKQSLSRDFCPGRRRIPSLSSDRLSYSTEKSSH